MEQQFSLSWNNFHGNLTNGFAGLLGRGEFVDVTIAVEGHLLQAHKVILSICSPYFKKMFQMTPCQHPIVVLRDVTHRAMRDLLQFMYHGEVSVKREDLNNFIGTAEVLQIKGLTNKETDEDDKDRELKIPKDNLNNHSNLSVDVESCISDTHSVNNETNKLDNLHNQKQLIEKFQRISNLKRRSEEFLQKNYYTELISTEKRPKLKEKTIYNKQNNILLGSIYENQRNSYDDDPVDIPISFNSHQNSSTKNEELDKSIDSSTDNCLDLKTECEDTDIVVTDPAIHKSYEGQNDLPASIEYNSPQDNCTSLNSLFMDLKNLVNGKVSNMLRTNTNEEYLKHTTDHRLVTIPQKEDGKKKYPQRSCRLCWKIGKRRDTRFMCFACDLPFCKSPCFEIHFNDVLKISQFHGEYYAT